MPGSHGYMDIIVDRPTDFSGKKPQPVPGETLRQRKKFGGAKRHLLVRAALAEKTFTSLKNYVDPFGLGVWTAEGPRPLLTKKKRRRLLAAYQAGKFIVKPTRLIELIQGRMDSGTKGYYTSGHYGYALLRVEVDAHEDWQTDLNDTEAAVAMLFPKAYRRKSTRGAQLHLKVLYHDLEGDRRTTFNAMFKRMAQRLTKHFKSQGYKCTVELQGGITTSDPGAGFGHKCARLAQLPPILNGRDLEEFDAQEPVDFQNVYDLVMALPYKEAEVKRQVKKHQGSGGSRIYISDEDLDTTRECYQRREYKQLAYRLAGNKPACARNVTYKHFLTGLALFNIAHKYKKEDGSLPSKFIKTVWDILHHEGLAPYWHASVWKCVRDTMSEHGTLDWQSNQYWHYNGEKPGQCMRFGLKEELLLGNVSPQTTTHYIENTLTFWLRPQLVRPPFDALVMPDLEGVLGYWDGNEYKEAG
jgi:hypothetical protein